MKINKCMTRSVLLAVAVVFTSAPAYAYGPEGLFGGRPQPDSSIVLGNPVELRNDRPERAESVLEHPRPDYDPVPYEIGSFELFPMIELGESYDDNIYSAKTPKRSDAVGSIRPVVDLFSNWNRHALSVTAFGDLNYYSEHSNEDYRNAVLDVNGRVDIVNQMWVGTRAGYQHLTESRSSPDDAAAAEPTTFNMAKGGLTFYRGIGKLKANADYDYKNFDYNNPKTSTGVSVDQSTRNRDEHVMGAKLSYDLSGNVKPYVKGAYNIRDYDNNPTHDSTGYEANIGTTMDLGGITSIDLFAGYMQQNYDDFAVKNTVSSPKFGVRVDWNVTGMTSVVMEATRTIEETTLTNFNSYYATGGSVTLTHELRRNILLEANGAFTRLDFNGAGTRHDDNYTLGVGGRYLINRSLYTDVLYTWDHRVSTDSASDYNRNLASVRLGVRF